MKEASSDRAALLHVHAHSWHVHAHSRHVHAHSRHVHAQPDGGSEVRCGRVSGSEVKRPGWLCYCSPDVIKVRPPLLPRSFPPLLLSILPLFLTLSFHRLSPKRQTFTAHCDQISSSIPPPHHFPLTAYLFCFCPPDPTRPVFPI